VYLTGEEEDGRNNNGQKSPCENAPADNLISATRSTPSGRNTASRTASKSADETGAVFRPPHGYDVAEIDINIDKDLCGSQQGGIISATDTQSNEHMRPCIDCGGTKRWNDNGIWRCMVCWGPEKHGAKHDGNRHG
jgi:hypothetical protein